MIKWWARKRTLEKVSEKASKETGLQTVEHGRAGGIETQNTRKQRENDAENSKKVVQKMIEKTTWERTWNKTYKTTRFHNPFKPPKALRSSHMHIQYKVPVISGDMLSIHVINSGLLSSTIYFGPSESHDWNLGSSMAQVNYLARYLSSAQNGRPDSEKSFC